MARTKNTNPKVLAYREALMTLIGIRTVVNAGLATKNATIQKIAADSIRTEAKKLMALADSLAA